MSATNEKERESIDNWYVPEIMQPFVNQTNKNKKKAKSPELRVLVMIYNFIYYDSNLFFFFFFLASMSVIKVLMGQLDQPGIARFIIFQIVRAWIWLNAIIILFILFCQATDPIQIWRLVLLKKKKKKKASLYNHIMHTD